MAGERERKGSESGTESNEAVRPIDILTEISTLYRFEGSREAILNPGCEVAGVAP